VRLLLDTHCFLWMAAAPERFSRATLTLLQSPEHELLLSAASSWEIAIKYALGRLVLPHPPAKYVPSRLEMSGVRGLAIEHAHALAVSSLPPHHADPFDRLLIAQARTERLTILTADPHFARYDVDVLEA
jgi:PIN domain nuclease of toxin-antitoxin system